MESPDVLDPDYLDKMYMVRAISETETGVAFLQWLCKMTGFNRPTMNMEEAVRRDVWMTIRRYVPVDKLTLIEHADLRREQQLLNEMLQAMKQAQAEDAE